MDAVALLALIRTMLVIAEKVAALVEVAMRDLAPGEPIPTAEMLIERVFRPYLAEIDAQAKAAKAAQEEG